ncbi:phage antirepressor N-terminal domain-containing protein [Aneurinibacillus sp. Ricciae_BoGa-3]|uniref:phage antirepressor N-terminal domain-containing protein n=1 Tax=Aneurinibacillus sp. Ricciae_BoGa-3 TaxID=3022697 RepID=UPI002340B4EC|nr:phage antirepressor N-terminal domain-containing protein [Aneurinibacillus sp. Ricciae_BoGa-3]WCK55554.1 phage antirepressor N-terminal domain-containing protein [Aneurinibacillus sp. Ricciae_BoGa-3]
MKIIEKSHVKLHEDVFQSVVVQNSEEETATYVPFKRLCENLGLGFSSQTQKVRGNAALKAGIAMLPISVSGSDGGVQTQRMLCLRYEMIPAWLMTIGAGRVKQHVYEKLQKYLACFTSCKMDFPVANVQKESSSPYLYFAQAYTGESEKGPIKIGIALDVVKRLKEIRCFCPFQVELLASMTGSVEAKKEVHHRFSNYLIHGEWFEPKQELLYYIESLKQDQILRPVG